MKTREDKYIDPSSAKTYADNSTVQSAQAINFLESYKDYLKSPVLDFGCGPGNITAYIGNTFHLPITGLDISEARVTFANEKHGSNLIKFCVGDGIKLDQLFRENNQKFGSIVSFNTLHHIPKKDHLETFVQIRKQLKPNGAALLLIPGRTPVLADSINETMQDIRWKQYFVDFDINSIRTYETSEYYKNLCSKAGFFGIKVTTSLESGGKELNFEGIKNFLSGWLPHLAHLKEKGLDEKLTGQFLSDIVTLYFSKMNKKLDETINISVTQNRIIAQTPPRSSL